jgi:hypothetical protein
MAPSQRPHGGTFVLGTELINDAPAAGYPAVGLAGEQVGRGDQRGLLLVGVLPLLPGNGRLVVKPPDRRLLL